MNLNVFSDGDVRTRVSLMSDGIYILYIYLQVNVVPVFYCIYFVCNACVVLIEVQVTKHQ